MPHQYSLLREFAARNHDVATVAELTTIGFARTTIYRWVRDGRFQLLHPSVINLGISELSDAGRYRAATLACGKHTLLTGSALGHLLGAINEAPLVVDVLTAHHAGSFSGVRTHQAQRLPMSRRVLGIDVVSVEELMCSLVIDMTYPEIAHVMHRLAWKDQFVGKELKRYLDTQRGRRGIGVVHAALDLHSTGSAGARSRSEVRLHSMLLRMRVPHFLFNVPFNTPSRRLEPDIRFPSLMLVIEVDGRHGTPEQIEEDRRRDEALRDAGYRVIRIPWRDVWRRPIEVQRIIERAIAQAQFERSRA